MDSFSQIFQELRSRSSTSNQKVYFTVVFRRPYTTKDLRRTKKMKHTFFLSQDFKAGFLGLSKQERGLSEALKQNLVLKQDLLFYKKNKLSKLSMVLTNPSVLSELSRAQREYFLYWKRFPSMRLNEFVCSTQELTGYRKRPHRFEWNSSQSLILPVGYLNESTSYLVKQFKDIVRQYRRAFPPKMYPCKKYLLSASQGAKLLVLNTHIDLEN